jgi:hypothetical protein
MDFDFGQISELLENMSPEEMQNLQQMAQSMFGQLGGEPPPPPEEGGPGGGEANPGFFSPELAAKLAQLMQQMQRRDARTDLILALKPHLSRRRQLRAEQAVQMMRMLELLPTLQEAFKG